MNRRNFFNYVVAAGATTFIPEVITSNPLLNMEKPGFARGDKELDYHVLDRITFTTVKLSYPRLVGRNAQKGIHGYGPKITICTLFTKQGAQGIGILRGSKKDAEKAFEALKSKKLSDVFSIEAGVLNEELMIFDIPLHDLAGVVLAKPVYKLL